MRRLDDGIRVGTRIPLPSLRAPRHASREGMTDYRIPIYYMLNAKMARTTLSKLGPRVITWTGRDSDSSSRTRSRTRRTHVTWAWQSMAHRCLHLCNGESTAGETHLKTWPRSHIGIIRDMLCVRLYLTSVCCDASMTDEKSTW